MDNVAASRVAQDRWFREGKKWLTASGAARSSTLPQRNGALNAQRTLTPSRFRLSELAARVAAAAAAAARTKQLFYPGSGLLELFLKSPPHNGEARTRERGERDKELVELKRVCP